MCGGGVGGPNPKIKTDKVFFSNEKVNSRTFQIVLNISKLEFDGICHLSLQLVTSTLAIPKSQHPSLPPTLKIWGDGLRIRKILRTSYLWFLTNDTVIGF